MAAPVTYPVTTVIKLPTYHWQTIVSLPATGNSFRLTGHQVARRKLRSLLSSFSPYANPAILTTIPFGDPVTLVAPLPTLPALLMLKGMKERILGPFLQI